MREYICVLWEMEKEDGTTFVPFNTKLLNKQIFETMYFAAVTESVNISKRIYDDKEKMRNTLAVQLEDLKKLVNVDMCLEPGYIKDLEKALDDLNKNPHGYYDAFPDSPASKGLFQFDLWEAERREKEMSEISDKDISVVADCFENILDATPRYKPTKLIDSEKWEELRKDMIKYGMRNSLLIALMPTASSSHIIGNNECYEAFTGIIFTRKVLSGQYIVSNKYCVRDLQRLGCWNTAVLVNILENGGSIQYLTPEIAGITDPEKIKRLNYIRQKYKNSFELQSIGTQLKLALDRAPYIDQTQSHNCWMRDPTYQKLTSHHFQAWKGGAKTGMYYLRQPAKHNPINYALLNGSIQIGNVKNVEDEVIECIGCSA